MAIIILIMLALMFTPKLGMLLACLVGIAAVALGGGKKVFEYFNKKLC